MFLEIWRELVGHTCSLGASMFHENAYGPQRFFRRAPVDHCALHAATADLICSHLERERQAPGKRTCSPWIRSGSPSAAMLAVSADKEPPPTLFCISPEVLVLNIFRGLLRLLSEACGDGFVAHTARHRPMCSSSDRATQWAAPELREPGVPDDDHNCPWSHHGRMGLGFRSFPIDYQQAEAVLV